MSETKDDEQKASGAPERLLPVAWCCEDCGNTVEQARRPRSCLTCERFAARRGEDAPDTDWRPLYDLAAIGVLVAEAYARCGHGQDYANERAADLLAEVLGV